MGEHNIDIGGLKTLQATLEAFNNVLPRQSSGVRLLSTSAKENLQRIRNARGKKDMT